jgi:hypothetical protein
MVRSPQPLTLSEAIAAALAQFDRFAAVEHEREITPEEELVLACLGAALVAEWNRLPRDVQRQIFERASALGAPAGGFGLRQELATFLHDHHARTAPAGGWKGG